MHAAAFIGVFHGIIQKKPAQLCQGPSVSVHPESLPDINIVAAVPGSGRRAVRLRALSDQLRQVDLRECLPHQILLHPGEGQHVVNQISHSSDLMTNRGRPVILLPIHLQHIDIGRDDGQRCLQLMSCIRNKLLLFLQRFHHRPDRHAGQQPDQKKHQSKCRGTDQKSAAHQVCCCRKTG